MPELTNLEKAIDLSRSKTRLEHHLWSQLNLLRPEYRKHFPRKGTVFNFEQKRLISPYGVYHLVWLTRPYPNLPESPENQQTSVGCVSLLVVTVPTMEQDPRKIEDPTLRAICLFTQWHVDEVTGESEASEYARRLMERLTEYGLKVVLTESNHESRPSNSVGA